MLLTGSFFHFGELRNPSEKKISPTVMHTPLPKVGPDKPNTCTKYEESTACVHSFSLKYFSAWWLLFLCTVRSMNRYDMFMQTDGHFQPRGRFKRLAQEPGLDSQPGIALLALPRTRQNDQAKNFSAREGPLLIPHGTLLFFFFFSFMRTFLYICTRDVLVLSWPASNFSEIRRSGRNYKDRFIH